MNRLQKTLSHPLINGYVSFLQLIPKLKLIDSKLEFSGFTHFFAFIFWVCVVYGGVGSLTDTTFALISAKMALNLFFFLFIVGIFKWIVIGRKGIYDASK
ncbi:hypothetical protein Q6U52_000887 [Vibrio alginolyticus]|nr:hypothetical protein [Vibrio alginolyticus]